MSKKKKKKKKALLKKPRFLLSLLRMEILLQLQNHKTKP